MKSSHSKSPHSSPSGINVGTWMPAEDARLKNAVAKYGPRWVLVAGDVSTRTGDQCAKRWNENLNPELDHGPWNAVEDKLLLDLVTTYGHDWKFMAQNYFEKRAPLALKNRNSLLKRRQKRHLQAAAASERQNTPSSTGSPAPSMPFTPQYPYQSNLGSDMGGSYYPEGTLSGTSSPYQPSIMDGDFPLYSGPADSITDYADMFGDMASVTSSPAMGYTPLIPRSSQPTSAPDLTAWQKHLNSNPTFGDSSRYHTHSMGLEGNNPPSYTTSERSPGGSVEYSVTCPRENLRNLVSQLVDVAMSGSTTTSEANQVMLTLRLRDL